jgi:hypothetical protein
VGDGKVNVNNISLLRLSSAGQTDLIDGQTELSQTSGAEISRYDFDFPDISGINVGYVRSRIDFNPNDQDITLDVNLWQAATRQGKAKTLSSCKFNRRDLFQPLSKAVTVGTKLTIAGGINGCPVIDPSFQTPALTQGIAGSTQLTTLANGTTRIPGTAATLPLKFKNPVAKGPNVLFSDENLYLSKSGVLSTIATIGQDLPNGNGKLQFLCGNDFDVQGVVFCGIGTTTGIYFKRNQVLTTVVAKGAQVPGENRTFGALEDPKISGSNILFTEFLSGGETPLRNLYVKYGGKITKVIGTNSPLKGKTVASFTVGKRPISGDTIVFAVKFTDGNGSVVKAKLSP